MASITGVGALGRAVSLSPSVDSGDSATRE
jgi:hypothetical protein